MIGIVLFSALLNMALSDEIYLEEITTLYIPTKYLDTGTAVYGFDDGTAEQSDYDAVDKIVYIVGKNTKSVNKFHRECGYIFNLFISLNY